MDHDSTESRGLIAVHACFELLCDGREADAMARFQPAIVAEARALLGLNAQMSSVGAAAASDGIGPGAVLGEFTLVRPVGQGGLGRVFEAIEHGVGRHVAVKVMPAVWRADDRPLRPSEARLLAQLEHPGIARLYRADVTELNGRRWFWIAMELVRDARTLTDWATVQGRSIDERIEAIATVAEAVQHAHGRGVIHRDLKPGNVLVDGDGRAVVIDFGIAGMTEQAPAVTNVLLGTKLEGTLGYVAPESLDPHRPPDVRSDLFALGAMLFELISGRPLRTVAGATIAQQLHIVSRPVIVQLPQLTGLARRELERIIRRATAHDPADRYQTAAQFAEDLRRHLRGEPVLTQEQGAVERWRRALWRHRLPVAVGSAVSASLLALTLVAVNQTARARHESRLARLSLASRALVDADRLVIERVVDAMDDEAPTFERDLLRRMLAVGQAGLVPMTCLDWDVVDGIGLGIFEDASAPVHGPMLAQVVDGHVIWSMPIVSPEVGALALSADRTRALVCTQGGHVAWQDLPIGSATQLPRGSGNPECNQGSITQTGSGHLVCAGTTVHVIEPGAEDASWSLEPNLGLIRDLAASPSDPSLVLLGAEEGVLLLDVSSRSVRTLGDPGERARAVAWSPDGRMAFVASRALTAFDASTGVRMWTAQGHQSGIWGVVALDHGRCATASADGSIRVWSTKDGTAIGALPLSSDRLWSLGTDGDVLTAGGSRGAYTITHREVRDWFGNPGGSLAFDVQPGVGSVDAAGRDQVRISTRHDPARIINVLGIGVAMRSSMSPSGDLIALAGDSGAVMLLRSDGSPIWIDRGHGSPDDVHEPQGFRSIDIAPGDGHVLLGARQFGAVCLDRHDGHVRWTTRLPSECESVAWSHDGRHAFLVTREGQLLKLDAGDGRVLQSVQPFKQGAGAVTVSADGSRVLAGSGEGALVVFDAQSLEELVRIPVMQRVIEHLWLDVDGVHLVDVAGRHVVR